MRPADVWRMLVMETFTNFPMDLLALSMTIIVPSSIKAIPWFFSLPSFFIWTLISSPENTTGRKDPARSFTLRTLTPSSLATLFRLKSVVIIKQPSIFASLTSFASTSLMSGRPSSCIITSTPFIPRNCSSISSPLLPLLRLESSELSAIC